MSTRRRRAGYTLIEVLMAIGVLSAGAVAIMAMHQASTRGNMEAREMGTASQLAQRWVERLRRDGINWTRSSNTATPDPTLLLRTQYLRAVTPAAGAALWFTPPVGAAESPSFDYYGNDIVGGGATPHYCTNIRLEWLYPGQAMRADVRVWWTRRRGGSEPLTSGAAALANCAAGTNPNSLTGDRRTRMVYTSTVIRYTPPAPS